MSPRLAALALVLALAGACVDAPTAAPTVAAHADAGDAGGVDVLCDHKVPAAVCTQHHPALAAVFKSQGDWCPEHGVPLSHCYAHNPNLTFASAPVDWCQEHGVPESACTKCHPALVAKYIAADDYCREHGFPASLCPICHPELPARAGQVAPTFPDPALRVRLASKDTAADAGLRTTRVARRAFGKTLEVTGELGFDGNAQAQVSTKDDARVLEVLVDVGDEVKAGQKLVVLASADAGADRAELTSAAARMDVARKALARLEQLQGVASQRELDEARRDVATAEAAHEAALAGLRASGADVGASSGGRLVLTAPLAGTVVARDAVPGRTTRAGDVLVHIANTRTLWATLDVPEEASSEVRAGQAVELRFDGLRAEARRATIARVGASIDPHTRTLRARVDVANADGRLKAGLFLRALIAVAEERAALLVPRAAVQHAEGKALVFVVSTEAPTEGAKEKSEGAVFRPVAVTLGAGDAEDVEVLSGLAEGDEIVTVGAFLLKTEILKDSIGAGCCD